LVRASIATLRPGQEVAGVFACTRKDRLVARTGTPYLAVELRDRTGAMPARAFRDADVLAGRFDRGGHGDPATFLPVAYRDLDELDGFLEHLAHEVHDRPFAALLERLLADEQLRAEWRRAPCTRDGHHAYLGGLLEHTVAVAQLALETCQLHVRLNSDLLLTAALVHDLGKTREFEYGAEIAVSDEGRMLGHVELGLDLLRDRAAGALDRERLLALSHCVLTHHGPDRAPARRFASAEALALYRLNALDATVKGALEHGLG
jgi:3'-5' exoribonuclease